MPDYGIKNRDDYSRSKDKHIVPHSVATPTVVITADDEWGVFENNLGDALVLTRATFIPNGTAAGDNTNNFTLYLYNRGAAAGGTVVMASLAFVTGVDLAINIPTDLTLSTTMANRLIAEGDVLAFVKTEAAAGLELPDGTLQLEFGFRAR